MRVIVVLAGFLLLSGCVTAEQQMAKDDAACLSYGAQKGSDAYVACRMQLTQNRSNANMVNSLSPGSFLLGTIQKAAE